MKNRVIQQPCQIWQVQIRQEGKFGLLVITWEKGAWSLTRTRLPGKVWLLASILVETMALASVWIFHMWRHHWMISQIGHRLLGMHYIRRNLGRVTPCQSRGDRHSSLSGVPLIVEIITLDHHSGHGNGSLPRIPRSCCRRSS
jgi:hypothetical protein